MGLFIPEVFTLLLTDFTAFLLLLYTTPSALKIFKEWDIESCSDSQYRLEKKRHLLSAVVASVFVFKIPLFLYYIYTNDKMANVLTGAMCAAGSINATPYGSWLIMVKIINIFMMAGWLSLYSCNSKNEKLPYTKIKYGFLLVISSVTGLEALLSIANFYNIDPTAVVSCCSSIYSATLEDGISIMTMQPFTAYFIFSASTLFLVLATLLRYNLLIFVCNIVFFLTAILNLILFTSTYIYELPSHRCPYCILQPEYHYVGYLFYITLFFACAGILNIFIKSLCIKDKKEIQISYPLFFVVFYYFISSFFPLMYYFNNGVWL